jgi:histidine triad (HIT) family protein
VQGKAPCHLVHEDEMTMSFMDINPVAAGHVLIIPRQHYSDIFSISAAASAAVARSSVLIAAAMKQVIPLDGIGIHQLNGTAAGQTVFHYHTHVIPRQQGDAITIHSRQPGDSQQLALLAQQIQQALKQQGH